MERDRRLRKVYDQQDRPSEHRVMRRETTVRTSYVESTVKKVLQHRLRDQTCSTGRGCRYTDVTEDEKENSDVNCVT